MTELLNEETIDCILQAYEDIKYTPFLNYAMIGSRSTSPETCKWLYELAIKLIKLGAVGYSGGAEGADTSLTKAVEDSIKVPEHIPGYRMAKIFIGWYNFNSLKGGDLEGAVIDGSKVTNVPLAKKLARTLHPAFDKMKPGAQALHTRNCFQILGESLANPVDVVFYSADNLDHQGRPIGGTATAWKLATALGVPTFNVNTADGRDGANEWVNEYIEKHGDKTLSDIFNKETITIVQTPPSRLDEIDEDIQF